MERKKKLLDFKFFLIAEFCEETRENDVICEELKSSRTEWETEHEIDSFVDCRSWAPDIGTEALRRRDVHKWF